MQRFFLRFMFTDLAGIASPGAFADISKLDLVGEGLGRSGAWPKEAVLLRLRQRRPFPSSECVCRCRPSPVVGVAGPTSSSAPAPAPTPTPPSTATHDDGHRPLLPFHDGPRHRSIPFQHQSSASPSPSPSPSADPHFNDAATATATVDAAPKPRALPSDSAKKKRGRPRKYSPDGNIALGLAPGPTHVAPSSSAEPLAKKHRGCLLAPGRSRWTPSFYDSDRRFPAWGFGGKISAGNAAESAYSILSRHSRLRSALLLSSHRFSSVSKRLFRWGVGGGTCKDTPTLKSAYAGSREISYGTKLQHVSSCKALDSTGVPNRGEECDGGSSARQGCQTEGGSARKVLGSAGDADPRRECQGVIGLTGGADPRRGSQGVPGPAGVPNRVRECMGSSARQGVLIQGGGVS
ncbi:hypothetical protein Fmac_006346 [Flemingia macrophylla]|uniref:AT-hook motif nuclear-localized protein n=1 Tax=Flemingia macrophylla TaxID=520843 RepID=A0ABD1NAW0_9FABA